MESTTKANVNCDLILRRMYFAHDMLCINNSSAFNIEMWREVHSHSTTTSGYETDDDDNDDDSNFDMLQPDEVLTFQIRR